MYTGIATLGNLNINTVAGTLITDLLPSDPDYKYRIAWMSCSLQMSSTGSHTLSWRFEQGGNDFYIWEAALRTQQPSDRIVFPYPGAGLNLLGNNVLFRVVTRSTVAGDLIRVQYAYYIDWTT